MCLHQDNIYPSAVELPQMRVAYSLNAQLMWLKQEAAELCQVGLLSIGHDTSFLGPLCRRRIVSFLPPLWGFALRHSTVSFLAFCGALLCVCLYCVGETQVGACLG
jgi:hypothetical protein